MHARSAAAVLGFCGVLAFALAAEPSPDSKEPPQRSSIREFDPETAARLGRAIYEEDQLAWRATDVLQATVSRKELETEQPAGWVVDTTGETPIVRFLRQAADGIEASRDVVFKTREQAKIATPEDRRLSPGQLAKVRALSTAERALRAGEHPWCGGTSISFAQSPRII